MSILDRNDPKIDRIRQVPFFSEASKKSLEHVAGVAEELDVPAGRVLIEQSRRHHEVFIIQSGTAEVQIDGETVGEVGEGEMLGEVAMLCEGPATATVKATTDMQLLLISYAHVDAVLEENPQMVRSIASTLAARLRKADARNH